MNVNHSLLFHHSNNNHNTFTIKKHKFDNGPILWHNIITVKEGEKKGTPNGFLRE